MNNPLTMRNSIIAAVVVVVLAAIAYYMKVKGQVVEVTPTPSASVEATITPEASTSPSPVVSPTTNVID